MFSATFHLSTTAIEKRKQSISQFHKGNLQHVGETLMAQAPIIFDTHCAVMVSALSCNLDFLLVAARLFAVTC